MTAVSRFRLVLVLAAGVFGDGPASGEPPHPHEPENGPEIEFPPEYEVPRAAREPRVREERLERRKVPSEGGMLHLPSGEFQMGYEGPLPSEPNERPAHLVQVASFWIDQTEVSVGDMRSCIDRGECTARLGVSSSCTLRRGDPKLPINCVPWQAADAYCRIVGKRLPTEAEWEWAAGAGQKTRFPWGSAAPASCDVAVTLISNRSGVSCSPQGPMAVGVRPRGESPFGVEDMAGNVEEWVADWYADRYEVLASAAAASPSGPAFGVAHVLRGGGWMSRPRETRVTFRSWGSLNENGPNVGFRCAKD